jgi:uncharacterized repeat protein (TIGR03803 family)
MQRHQGLAASFAAAAMLAWSVGAASATSFGMIYNFASDPGDANTPYAGLVIDAAGRLYGTAYGGGASGDGAVYRLAPADPASTVWTETILYSFRGGRDGAKPTGRLTFGPRGELFGTTSAGGSGHGTVFELAPQGPDGATWTETVLHRFSGAGVDGAMPAAGLAIDGSGTLYGTTFEGGAGTQDGPGYGTVFSLAPPDAPGLLWHETVLYQFSGAAHDGVGPQSDLLIGPGGALYGTTTGCGSRLACVGTVFRLARDGAGWTETAILALTGNGDAGAGPNRELAMDSAGALYGTTGAGTAFRLSPPSAGSTHWQHTVLTRFKPESTGGPQGGVLVAAGDALYGTLAYGPHKSGGSIYALTQAGSAAWSVATLYRFGRGGPVFPVGSLVADASGAMYGVTEIGGARGVGTVFRVMP